MDQDDGTSSIASSQIPGDRPPYADWEVRLVTRSGKEVFPAKDSEQNEQAEALSPQIPCGQPDQSGRETPGQADVSGANMPDLWSDGEVSAGEATESVYIEDRDCNWWGTGYPDEEVEVPSSASDEELYSDEKDDSSEEACADSDELPQEELDEGKPLEKADIDAPGIRAEAEKMTARIQDMLQQFRRFCINQDDKDPLVGPTETGTTNGKTHE